jgi:hypothetical protein
MGPEPSSRPNKRRPLVCQLERETSSRSSDRRLYSRQRVLLSCLQVKDDNGGVVLDISEQGLAMQAVKSLGTDTYTQLRFQLSQSDYWVETHARIAWISPSRQTAGMEFVGLSNESLIFIKRWILSTASLKATEEENAIIGSVTPPNSALRVDEPMNVTSLPESAKTNPDVEELVQELIIADLAAMLSRAKNKHAGAAAGNAGGGNECRTLDENIIPINGLDLTPHLQGADVDVPLANNEPPCVESEWRQYITLLAGVALLLSGLLFFDHSLRKAANGPLDGKAPSSEKLAEMSSKNSTNIIAPRKPSASSDAGFILQIVAMKDEQSAISLADLLHRKGFPAYVFKPAAKSFYRVLAGPYSDANSATQVEEELRRQGFEAIRKRNTLGQ